MMGKKMNKMIIFIVLLLQCNLFALEDEPSLDGKYVNEIIRTFAEEMQQEFGLECSGSGGSMPHDVESIAIEFNAYQRATIAQACALEVTVTEKLLNAINTHLKLDPI